MINPVKVKICGVTRRVDAIHAADVGADYVGMILTGGFGRSISASVAADISDSIEIPTVGVFVDEAPDVVAARCEVAGVEVAQLHGSESPYDVQGLREAGPWRIWKSFSMRDPEEASRLPRPFAEIVDGVLFDAWHPDVPGGGGTPFAWADFRVERDRLNRSVEFVLAGGLHAANVDEAISALKPDIVDVSSGVERAPGVKDPRKVEAFVQRARGANAAAGDSSP